MSRNFSNYYSITKHHKHHSHSGLTDTKISRSTQKNTQKYDTKWLNNVIQGKGLIEISIRQHKWNDLIKLINSNKKDWMDIVNSDNSDILLQIFRAHKYKLILNIHQKYPIKWTIQHLSYLIASPPKICTIEYKTKQIQQQIKGDGYIKLYKLISSKVDMNHTVKWNKQLLIDEIDSSHNIHIKDDLSLIAYALIYDNLYVLNDLINKNEYKIGQIIIKNNKAKNFIQYFVDFMIDMDNNTESGTDISHKHIYSMFIKKLFNRQNINWNFKIKYPYHSDKFETLNLLTYIYTIIIPQKQKYNQLLFEICQESIKNISPNKPDISGNYPLDIYIESYDGSSPIYYPYIKLLIDNGANKYNTNDISMDKNNKMIMDDIHLVIENYHNYHKNMVLSYKYIIKYIKDNNVVEKLIKSRFAPIEHTKLLKLLDINKNMTKTIFNIYDNVKIVLSLCNYLSHTLLAHDRIISYQYYHTVPVNVRKILKHILIFYTSIDGLNRIEHFKEKDELNLDIVHNYNLHPVIYKFPIIYKVSRNMMNMYPKNSYVVTIGESLDKILFLQNLIQEHELKYKNNTYINLPFSGQIKTNTEPETIKLANKYCKYLYKKNIHPEQIVNKNQSIVIVDFASTGKGIYSFIYMYYKLCTQGWSKYKINKLNKLIKIVVTTAWDHPFHTNLRKIGLSAKEIRLPYHILSYLYDTNNYRCMKEFKTDKWKELDDINFDEKKIYEIGQELNGCNLVRFYIIDKYLEFLNTNTRKTVTKKKLKTKSKSKSKSK